MNFLSYVPQIQKHFMGTRKKIELLRLDCTV